MKSTFLTAFALFITLTLAACLFDGETSGRADNQIIKNDTTFQEVLPELSSVSTAQYTLLNVNRDSILVFTITDTTDRKDSVFKITVTVTLGSLDSIAELKYAIPAITTSADTVLTASYQLEAGTLTIDSNQLDTLIIKETYPQKEIFVDNLKIVEDSIKTTTIFRTVTIYNYKYISSAWSQDAGGAWVENADTIPGSINLPAAVDTTIVRALVSDTFNLAENMVLAVTSDYFAGSYSAITLEGAVIQNNIAPIHSDAIVRFFGGDDIYIINRYKRDNVQVIDRNNLKTKMQFALPALSNPNDMAASEDKLYFILFGKNSIEVHDKATGTHLEAIDISAYADSADSLAEAVQGLIIEDTLYVLLQRMDRTNARAGLHARLLRSDLTSKEISDKLLPFTNPTTLLASADKSKLYITSMGTYGKQDGGIISLNPGDMSITDTILTEADLGGDLNTAILWENTVIMSVSSVGSDKILYSPVDAVDIKELGATASWSLYGLAIDSVSKTLYVGDKVNGIRLFNLETFSEKSTTNIGVGLPVADITVVR